LRAVFKSVRTLDEQKSSGDAQFKAAALTVLLRLT